MGHTTPNPKREALKPVRATVAPKILSLERRGPPLKNLREFEKPSSILWEDPNAVHEYPAPFLVWERSPKNVPEM